VVSFASERTRVDAPSTAVAGDQLRLLAPAGPVAQLDDDTQTPIHELDARPRGFMVGALAFALVPNKRRIVDQSEQRLLVQLLHRGDVLRVRHVMESDGDAVRIEVQGAPALVLPCTPPERAFLGSMRYGNHVPGALAVVDRRGGVLMVRGREHFVFDEVWGAPHVVIGCCLHPAHGPAVLVREDERRLVIVGEHVREHHAFASLIVAVASNIEAPQIAVLTADGTVTVLFLKTGVRRVVCRSKAGASP
jgi:hypothetical protein